MSIKSWEISDKFWAQVEPLIPKRQRKTDKKYLRRAGGGRKPMDYRKVFAAIVYILRTGIQWKALPGEFGCASSVHAYFQEWERSGLFREIWKKGLCKYDDMNGIAWEWQSVDGSTVKAPLAQEAVGPNPTDRGKKWKQKAHSCGGAWSPAVNHRDRRKPA